MGSAFIFADYDKAVSLEVLGKGMGQIRSEMTIRFRV